jgi:FAD-dependent oxidoreductase domain-containing protein 1
MPENFDVVIAGGAVMGSSVACFLAQNPGFSGSILVIEPDMSYQKSASALSAGSIRQQFSQRVNIEISLFGIRFLREISERLAVGPDHPDIGLREGGYLYLGAEEARQAFAENNAIQRASGADTALLETQALAEQFPWLQVSDLAIGSFGRSGEGWFDGYGLMQAFRNKARALGVTYRQGRVIGADHAGGRVNSVTLEGGARIACGAFVNAAGASGARDIAAMLGAPIAVYAKKRSVFSFSCKDNLPRHPLIIDKSGVWWRPEGEGYISGFSPDDDNVIDQRDDFEVDWPIFEDIIWPVLAHRIPAFEAIRPGRAWAGHYDMHLLDHNAIVGRVTGFKNAYLACGFSGHGLQQAPAVGRGLAELIVDERYTTLDLADLGMERVAAGKPLRERNVI